MKVFQNIVNKTGSLRFIKREKLGIPSPLIAKTFKNGKFRRLFLRKLASKAVNFNNYIYFRSRNKKDN